MMNITHDQFFEWSEFNALSNVARSVANVSQTRVDAVLLLATDGER